MNLFSDIKMTAEKYLAGNHGDSIYLLIDHAGMPGLLLKIRNHYASWASLFDATRESGALPVAPILILVGRSSSLLASNAFVRWISERAVEGSSVIMLASSMGINELRGQLTKRLDVRISENMDAMLRFFDAKILEQLVRILTPEQIAVLCSPAKKWWYVDRMGELVGIDREFEHIGSDSPKLDLSEKQEFALINASEPDQVLHLLMNAMPQLRRLMPKNQYSFIADNISSASRLGLCSVSDFVLYSVMVTLRGSDFDVLPYWKTALEDVRVRRISFADAVARSEDIVWEVE